MNTAGNTLIILTPGFPESEEDTACLPWMQNIVRKMKQLLQHTSITILSFQYPYRKQTYHWEGIKVIPFGGANKGGLSKLLLRRQIIGQLNKIHRSETITGILSFWYGECARTGHRFARHNKLRHFCWIAGQDAKKDNRYPAALRINGSSLIAASDFLQEYFEQNHGVRPVHVIPPGVDASKFGSTETEKDIDILAAGSLIALKQFDLFVELIFELKKEFPGICAILIGQGPEKKNAETLISKMGLQGAIRLTGELPYKEVLQYMKRAKILLHPSAYEGFGCVCTEALHGGAKVISFVRPMKQDIENWHHAANKTEMAQKAAELLKDTGATYHPVTPFTAEETARSILQLFSSANVHR